LIAGSIPGYAMRSIWPAQACSSALVWPLSSGPSCWGTAPGLGWAQAEADWGGLSQLTTFRVPP